jgi:hypothetical protein
MESLQNFTANFTKKDLQITLLKSIAVAVVLHYGLIFLLPSAVKFINGYRSCSTALSEVESKSSSRMVSTALLEEEADRLRVEVMERSKTIVSKPTQQVIPVEKRFKINLNCDDDNEFNRPNSTEAVKPSTSATGMVNKSGKEEMQTYSSQFCLGQRVKDVPPPEHCGGGGASGGAERRARGGAPPSVPHRSLAPQYLYSPPPHPPASSDRGTERQYQENYDRQATLSEQDLAYEVSLRTDRTQRLMQEELAAEYERIVREYTAVCEEEPAEGDPDSITVVFKISDEVYAKKTNSSSASSMKHKKISHRFHLSEKVQRLFSFVFCHLYEFPGHEGRFLGESGNVPPLFTPAAACGGGGAGAGRLLQAPDGEGREEASLLLQERSDEFPSFVLICSYPRVELHSSALFFRDKLLMDPLIRDLKLKNNTLLSFRPGGD